MSGERTDTASVDEKLDAILRLLALRVIEGRSKTQAIVALGSAGLDRTIIAELVGTTPSMVSKTLSNHRAGK